MIAGRRLERIRAAAVASELAAGPEPGAGGVHAPIAIADPRLDELIGEPDRGRFETKSVALRALRGLTSDQTAKRVVIEIGKPAVEPRERELGSASGHRTRQRSRAPRLKQRRLFAPGDAVRSA